MAVKTVVLLAIKPKWAEKIYSGEKTVEIRRTMIHRWGSPVLLYESHPVMMVTGMMRFTERREVHTSDPLILADACLTRQEMDEYAGNRVVYSYRIADVKRFDRPMTMEELDIPGKQPVSFRYVKVDAGVLE